MNGYQCSADFRGVVIGYYESWSDRLECHQMAPSDLPLSEMTHLNYAFAYIDPDSYEVVTMDSQTPESLFKITVDAKQYNADLKVFVSIGGWTFSDNGTATQPLLSEISSTSSNRQKFADNVLSFLDHYGFDGSVFPSGELTLQNTEVLAGLILTGSIPVRQTAAVSQKTLRTMSLSCKLLGRHSMLRQDIWVSASLYHRRSGT